MRVSYFYDVNVGKWDCRWSKAKVWDRIRPMLGSSHLRPFSLCWTLVYIFVNRLSINPNYFSMIVVRTPYHLLSPTKSSRDDVMLPPLVTRECCLWSRPRIKASNNA